jgi:hypothetical protein
LSENFISPKRKHIQLLGAKKNIPRIFFTTSRKKNTKSTNKHPKIKKNTMKEKKKKRKSILKRKLT